MSVITVDFEVHGSIWHIAKALGKLNEHEILSFDTETKGVYTKAERKEARDYLKGEDLPVDDKRLSLQVEENSGLSFPSLVDVTHFVFGTSDSSSVVLLCHCPATEILIWNWIAKYDGLLLVHNTLFDLKLMYHRIGKLPKNYKDTQLLAKCLTNNVEVYKAKVGLKDLMGSYYAPMWCLVDEYEPDNIKDPTFLKYAAIDGAATFKLWFDIQGFTESDNE